MIPLHKLERTILEYINKHDERDLNEIAKNTNILIDQARRAGEWLKSRNLIEIQKTEDIKIYIERDNDQQEFKIVLPERKLIEYLEKNNFNSTINEINKLFKNNPKEVSAAIGYAKKNNWININNNDIIKNKIINNSLEEILLEKIIKKEIYYNSLSEKEKHILQNLKLRFRDIKEKKNTQVKIILTKSGKDVINQQNSKSNTDINPIDVEAESLSIYPGKKHPVQRFIDEVREIFLALGFKEIMGDIIQSSFWNFDCLFTPQDHPAREMQDTFYIDKFVDEKLERNNLVSKIAKVHEDGGNTGSKGWGYKWNFEKAKTLVLRTHTTPITLSHLANNKLENEKVFCIGKVFRNEKITFKNLMEFHQIEGVVTGENVNLRDMMGLLTKFYNKLGLKKVKFCPSYFPYTEPSLQSMVYHEKLNKWVELCGMGIFRPEVTLPLGIKTPVLAWGGGLERLVMLKHNLNDVRKLYENDLSWLRESPLCL